MRERGDSRRCLVRLARPVAETHRLEHLLDATERNRLGRLSTIADRRRFTSAAALLRVTVADHLDIEPHSIRIDRTCADCGRPHGRPRVLRTGHDVHVSVSHSGGFVGVALTEIAPVGIDVEAVTADLDDLVDVACHPDERSAIVTSRDFTTVWVRKEAVLKAMGVGLRRDPATVVVTGPDEPAALRFVSGDASLTARLHDDRVDDAHVFAVAVLTRDRVEFVVEDASDTLAEVSRAGA